MRYNSGMTKYLDVTAWARREVFEFFRDFDKPYFNVCLRLDITNLLSHLRQRANMSKPNVSLAYHYFALRMAPGMNTSRNFATERESSYDK
jgi:chloramphenicol O-acetyltransferase